MSASEPGEAQERASTELRRPRGELAPPLPVDAPVARRLLRGTVRLCHGLVLHDVLLAAPAMAFHFFLALLPLLAFAAYVVGLIARRRGVEAVLSPLLDKLPIAAESLLRNQVERLASGSGLALGPVAALTFLWIASGGAHGLMSAIENVVGAQRRAWWRKRVLAIGVVLVALAASALAAFALVRWDALVHPRDPDAFSASGTPLPVSSSKAGAHHASASAPHVEPSDLHESEPVRRRHTRIVRSGGERALALTLSVLIGTLALAAFYRVAVSHSKTIVRRLLPGAALAVVLWLVISWAFGVYVSSLANYAAFYGSLAAVAVLLVWLWLTSFAILVGAELNSQLEGLRD